MAEMAASATLDLWEKLKLAPNVADLWPSPGEWLRYIGNDTFPSHPFDAKLTCNNEYEIQSIRFITCADSVKIADDSGNFHWVPLYKFSFLDYRQSINSGEVG